MKRSEILVLMLMIPLAGSSQALSTPGGTVSDNGTADYVIVNGQTKLVNPNGRTLLLERDDEDSWLMFHDPDQYWYSMGIDRSNNGAFTLNTGNTLGYATQFVMTTSGNVGIGTANPINIFDVNGVARFRRGGSVTSGFTIGGDALTLKGWGGNNPYIEWVNSADVRQGYMGWNTNRLSLVLENGYNFTVEHGNVGIGTTTPNEKLTVNGTIYGKEVKVDLSVPGPDYVFEKSYDLPTLEEIKTYIDQHKHLPDVPSAEEMKADGIKLAEMNMILLKKVEELTLYIMQQQQEIDKLKTTVYETK